MRGYVPEGWRRARLGDVAEVIGGTTPPRSKEEYWGGGIPWVVPSELTDLSGRYLTTTRESITQEALKTVSLRMIPGGSILLTTRATVGTTAINSVPVVTNQGFQNVVGKDGVCGLWLFYCVSGNSPELKRRAAGSTFREVSRRDVRSLPILLPPLGEQRDIAVVLDSIDEAIERTEALIAATEDLRESLRYELLTCGIPGWHSEYKEVPCFGTIPADWEVVRLGDVVSSRKEKVNPATCKWLPYIGLEHVATGGSLIGYGRASDTVSRKTVFYSGDTLFGKLRPYLRKVTRVNFDGICSTDILVLFALSKEEAQFVSHLLKSDSLYAYGMRGITGTRMPRTSWNHLRSFRFPIPPLPEQRAIARVLDSVDSTVEQLHRELAIRTELKRSVAEALLTGRVRVREGISA